jgi:hypothetical protein
VASNAAPVAAAPPAVAKPSRRFDGGMCRHAPVMPAMSLSSIRAGFTTLAAVYEEHKASFVNAL